MDQVELPPPLQGLFFDSLWETSKVWLLPTLPTLAPIEELAWHLDLPVWTTVRGESRFDLAPATVLATPSSFPRHWAKIQQAEILYPLELFRRGERWVILDGYHRLCRHWLQANPQVPIRLHPEELWEFIRRDHRP